MIALILFGYPRTQIKRKNAVHDSFLLELNVLLILQLEDHDYSSVLAAAGLQGSRST